MKTLTILRGLPGAGKSTRAKALRDKGALVLSNDDFFTDARTGQYKFNRAQLDKAIRACQSNTLLAMQKGLPHVVVDNCHIYKSGMGPYIREAQRLGYRVAVEVIGDTSPESVDTYTSRNVHFTPKAAIAAMAEKFER